MLKQLGVATVLATLVLPTQSARADDLRDYGEYLAGECTACHRDGANETIPPIVGYDVESFVALMNAYKSGERENEAMISVARALDDEQIKALGVYLGSIESKSD